MPLHQGIHKCHGCERTNMVTMSEMLMNGSKNLGI